MQYRRFGKTNLQIPVFTLGAMRFPTKRQPDGTPGPKDGIDNAIATIVKAVELGINHIETARGYGTSEELVGYAMPHLKRKQIIVTTKIGPTDTAAQFEKNLNESLTRMKCDWIDNLDIHGINNQALFDQTFKKDGCMEVVERALKDGRIRHIGFSTHAPLDIILKTINTNAFESINVHYYFFNQRNRPAVDLAMQKDMGVLIISPTDKGGLLHKPSPELAALVKPFTAIGINARWTMCQPGVTTLTLGAGTPQEYAEQIAVADGPAKLTGEETAVLANVDKTLRGKLGATWCSNCWECLPCPESITIPEILRMRNLTLGLGMGEFGKYRYNMFEQAGHWFPGNQATKCTDCGDCNPRCPEKLDIPKLIRETHEILVGDKGKRLWA
ncbi:MAG TPA: aldo/keto reductase [Planctomycetota bacterium]|nr:aldo/keto reductase [Planctomycetota bacterium]